MTLPRLYNIYNRYRKRPLAAIGLWGVFLGICLLTPSCGNNGCEETRETYLYTELKATTGMSLTSLRAWGIGQQHQTTYVTDTFQVVKPDTTYDSIAVHPVMVDSLMLSESSPTALEFILRPDTNFTRIRLQCIASDNGDEFQFDDTLSIWYEAVPYFLDMECGCSMYFSIRDAQVTQHLFKNIILRKSEITNEETVNLILQY
ncbi:MAG: hypothetical protein IJP70_03625 [Bacteroidales bacterium]|nr:hypothetical protein [Bacteroidales bacterium]